MADQPTPTTTELVTSSNARLEIQPGQQWWTEAQAAALSAIGLDKVPQGDAVAFLHLCQRTGLDPFAREIYLIGRKDSTAPSGVKYTSQTAIDGYRHVAERTGEFRGTEGPWWCGTDGQWSEVWFSEEPPVAAKVVVKRAIDGETVRFEAVAMYREFVATKAEYKDGQRTGRDVPAAMWAKMPAHMTAKCAEALAYRRAFPRQLNGTYIAEELARADVDAEQQHQEQLAASRAEARERYVRRPWDKPAEEGPGEPMNLADAAPGDVVPSEVTQQHTEEAQDADVEPDKEPLRAELDVIADLLRTTPGALATRAVRMYRRNLEDFDGWQLETLVESLRAQAAEAAQQRTQSAVEELAEEKAAVSDAPEAPTAPQESDEEREAREAANHERARERARGKSRETPAQRAARIAESAEIDAHHAREFADRAAAAESQPHSDDEPDTLIP
ncbi:phage recombination protein Bet [Phycicoccus sp.]|uniref:phage recombination protein Bet n=1 Tax=Phycicoccus sp. TaxID=1902410 RepID=UPI002D01E41C|nr:phage recombination protein Bet [Phycicoccus sp.]HMM95419.1 phage recombination protein Bet [Phycicoccus sp.]